MSVLYGIFLRPPQDGLREVMEELHRCNGGMEQARVLSRDLGGCSLEQNGEDFYVVGADSVRKKIG